MTPKQMLERALAGPQRPTPQPVTDEFAKAIAQKLETRGIVKVPGLHTLNLNRRGSMRPSSSKGETRNSNRGGPRNVKPPRRSR